MDAQLKPLKVPSILHLGRTVARVAKGGARMTMKNIADAPANLRFIIADPMCMRDAVFRCWIRSLAKPSKLLHAPFALWRDHLGLSKHFLFRLLSLQTKPIATPDESDLRFKDSAWDESPIYDALKQSYLLWTRWIISTVNNVDGLDEKMKKKLTFAATQYLNGLAPSNFLATNPVALRRTIETGGRNLVRGLERLAEDMDRSNGTLNVAMTDYSAFKVGQNLAITPGKVVYQNELFQLIQYEPTTETARRRPVLVIPSPMNKYYIMDLQPKNSMIRWLVDQGDTVFAISWVNPDETYRHMTYSDYVLDGVVTALGAVEQATGERVVDATGYCYGGILLASALGYLSATGDKRIASATMFTTMLDFTDVGDIESFIDDRGFPHLKRLIDSKGYLEGSKVAMMFRLLHSNELMWPFFVQSYLLGKTPSPFDMLFWNLDPTNMPATMHTYFIKKLYVENALKRPGGTSVAGVPVNLREVETPTYMVTAIKDHVSPWKTCYGATQLLSGSARFVLSKSGHLAGIINPPANNKYGFWTNDHNPENPEDWMDTASFTEGSWWSDWHKWLTTQDGERVAARIPGDGGLKPIEAAPGRYVRVRTDGHE